MLKKIWNYIINNKVINALNFTLLLILFIPYSYKYCGNDKTEKLTWNVNYVTDGIDLPILYSSIVVMILLFQLIQNKKINQILLGVIALICASWFYMALRGIILSDPQYFISGMGSYLSLLLFPLTLIKLFFRNNN